MLQGQLLLLLLAPVARRDSLQHIGVSGLLLQQLRLLLLLLLLLPTPIMLPGLGWLRFACLAGAAGVCECLWCTCMLLLLRTVSMLWCMLL
jgi:hypothetical protein